MVFDLKSKNYTTGTFDRCLVVILYCI